MLHQDIGIMLVCLQFMLSPDARTTSEKVGFGTHLFLFHAVHNVTVLQQTVNHVKSKNETNLIVQI